MTWLAVEMYRGWVSLENFLTARQRETIAAKLLVIIVQVDVHAVQVLREDFNLSVVVSA
jgi:hypothetical protein